MTMKSISTTIMIKLTCVAMVPSYVQSVTGVIIFHTEVVVNSVARVTLIVRHVQPYLVASRLIIVHSQFVDVGKTCS